MQISNLYLLKHSLKIGKTPITKNPPLSAQEGILTSSSRPHINQVESVLKSDFNSSERDFLSQLHY